MRRSHALKLDPNAGQARKLRLYCIAHCKIWNHFLEKCKKGLIPKKSNAMTHQLGNKRMDETCPELLWVRDELGMNKQIQQVPCEDLEKAWKRFFDWCRARKKGNVGLRRVGPPKFKSSRWMVGMSFGAKQGVEHDPETRKVRIPSIGWIRHFEKDVDFSNDKIKCCRVVWRASGWYCSLSMDNDIEIKSPLKWKKRKTHSVHLGIRHYAVLSDGNNVDHPRNLERNLDRLSKLCREWSRKKKGSRRWRIWRDRVRRVHEKIANCRKDFIHKMTDDLLKKYPCLISEKWSISDMVENEKTKRKRRKIKAGRRKPGSRMMEKLLHRGIMDSSWYEVRRQLKYKSEWRRKPYHETHMGFKSTQTCFHCKHVNDFVTLNMKTFTCRGCGRKIERESNAAANVREMGFSELGL